MGARDRHVLSGELVVGSGSDVLTCLLGSCVGIAILWKAGRRCGLAHCLLPDGAPGSAAAGARYVTTAIPALLAAMGVRREQFGEVEVVIAGGARMLAMAQPAVGPRNVAAAQAQLSRCGLAIRHADTGGYQGRRLRIDCATQGHSVMRVGAGDGAVADTERKDTGCKDGRRKDAGQCLDGVQAGAVRGNGRTNEELHDADA